MLTITASSVKKKKKKVEPYTLQHNCNKKGKK